MEMCAGINKVMLINCSEMLWGCAPDQAREAGWSLEKREFHNSHVAFC